MRQNRATTTLSLMNFLEKLPKIPIFMSLTKKQDLIYSPQSTAHSIHESIIINNTLLYKCMNLLFLPDRYQTITLDGSADTCVLG
jgi:hypothetical protein